jgi:hypothetical protein
MTTIKSTIRAVKAMGKGYSDLEMKARQATCNDAVFGPNIVGTVRKSYARPHRIFLQPPGFPSDYGYN